MRKLFGRRRGGKKDAAEPPKADPTDDSSDDLADDVADLPAVPENYNMKKNRHSVSAEAYGEWNKKNLQFAAPVVVKTPEQTERIKSALQNSFMFSSLDSDSQATVIKAFTEAKFGTGETIITQGDDGECLYLLESGKCDVYKKQGEEEKHVFVQKPGDAFGELALLYNCPRAATVKAQDDVVAWRLDRESFNHIVKDAAARQRQMYDGFLAEVDLLKSMDPYERSKLSDALKTVCFHEGDVVINEGDSGDIFFIIESGTADALKGEKVVKSYKRGEYFGELALLKDQPRAATVKATGPLKCVSLDRRSFKRLLGPLDDILKRNAEQYNKVVEGAE